jgi:RNA binding exosome subunit
MKCTHYVKVRVLVKPEDDMNFIEKTLRGIFPFELEKEKAKFEKHSADGFSDRKITILEVTLDKDKQITPFFKNLAKNLGEKQCKILIDQMDSRLDEGLMFYLRLDKEMLSLGTYELTDSGNCFHIHFPVACFPKDRNVAKKIIEEMFRIGN